MAGPVTKVSPCTGVTGLHKMQGLGRSSVSPARTAADSPVGLREGCSKEAAPSPPPVEVGAVGPAAEKDNLLPFRVSCKVCAKVAKRWLSL